MGRSGLVWRNLSGVIFIGLAFLLTILSGCSNSAVKSTSFAVPAAISMTPAPNLSLELGTYQQFSASPLSSTRTAINEPVSYQSSNTAVLTISSNGLACAGSWDSLTNPQICTPGPAGVALVTANAQGVSSPPTTVYVHQHIDSIQIAEIPPPPPLPPPPPGCSSVGEIRYYAATAFSRGANITPTVGVFTWQSVYGNVAILSTTAMNLLPGQIQVTAIVPGQTYLSASIGNNNSAPLYFTTCPVQSIALTVTSSSGTSKTIMPTVIDSKGTTIPPGTFLSWSSSESGTATVSSAGVVSTVGSGGASTIIASCSPPNCNTGFYPSLPIYPENVVTMISTGTSTSGTVYASSTSCGTTDGCVSTIVPITTPANTLGTFINLPTTPNSLVFTHLGNKAYLGTDSGLFGTAGLAVLDATANTVAEINNLPGKVLAISPDGNTLIVSDTSPSDGPNQVFVFNIANNGGTTFQITGATAAAFSPDSLKAYILAGNALYIYSKFDGLKTIPLAAPAVDVSFLSEGAFAYVAGGDPAGVTVRRTCDNSLADVVGTSIVPSFIKTLLGATGVLAVTSPNVSIINVNTTPVGCSPSVSDSVSSFNLGQGDFVAKQLIISQDGTTVYIVTSSPGNILVFNILSQTSSAITLTGNPVPLSASLSPGGNLLYVGANDGTVHVVNTVAGGDIQEIPFPQGLCETTAGQPFPVTCNPDLVAVKP
jgi:hypothetical protein